MKNHRFIIGLIIFCIFFQLEVKCDTPLKLEVVSGGVYCLYGDGGNIGILATGAGTLVVDSKFKSCADSVLQIIEGISTGKIKYLVNTHYHADHTGGNPVIGERAETILMHPNCKQTRHDLLAQYNMTDSLWENAVDWEEGMTLNMGEETIKLLHFGNAHTSGDLVVVFESAKVIHTGDLFFNGWPAYMDAEDNFNTENWIEAIEFLCKQYPDFKFIPGHGSVDDAESFLDFAGYLSLLRREVAGAIEAGKSREEAMDSILLEEYSHLKDPRTDGGLTIERNVGWIYDEMTRK